MNTVVTWVLVIVAILVVGIARILVGLKRQGDDEELFSDYCEHFNALLKHPDSKDTGEDRNWLIVNSHPMSDLLGVYGVGYNQIRGKVSIPLNLVPELCHDLRGFSLTPFMDEESCKAVMTCLGQFQGILDGRRKELVSYLKNPLRWLSEGVRGILSIPFFILESIGITRGGFSRRVASSRIMEVLAGVASIITIAVFVYQVLCFFGILQPLS